MSRNSLVVLSSLTAVTLAFAAGARPLYAQSSASEPAVTASGPTAQAPQDEEEDEAVLDPAEPDSVLINLPTTMGMPRLKGNFRMTHRFAGNLRNGSFSQQAANLFGLDQGAIIGLEYRIGLMRGLEAVVYRTNFDKTFQFSAKYDVLRQRGSMPFAVSAIVSVEGTDNFQKQYAQAVGVVLSRKVAGRIAAYAVPVWVNNSAASLVINDGEEHDHETDHEGEEGHVHRSTGFVGLGLRLRVLPTVYLVGEVTPRVGGYAPDKPEYGFGIEKRAGAHVFSLTFTNTFATTNAQIARGGAINTLYLGFNLGRKFF